MDVNAESSLLQPANRDGGIDQDWAGDDQDWWDWYVTLAENDDAPIALVAGPRPPASATWTPPAMSNCGSNSQPRMSPASYQRPLGNLGGGQPGQ